MATLRQGSRGPAVVSLQNWYTQFGPAVADGDFGPATVALTKKLQRRFGLIPDGVVGPRTAARFMMEGWLPEGFDVPAEDPGYPDEPTEYSPLTQAQKIRKFGRPGKAPSEPEAGGSIQLDPTFAKNIVRIPLRDWFPHVEGARVLEVHEKVENQWLYLLERIQKKKLGTRLLSCGGSWNPRFVRGRTDVFSSHAFGTAVDFNAPQNWLRAQPARRGETGCLLEIVQLLPELKMYWGGWFQRVDGMHIESTATDKELGW